MDITRESSVHKFNPILKAGKLLIKKSSTPTFYINFKSERISNREACKKLKTYADL